MTWRSTISIIPEEFAYHNRNDRSTVGIAHAGPNTGVSQFLVDLVDINRLDSEHPVFGKVLERIDVVCNIEKVETDNKKL